MSAFIEFLIRSGRCVLYLDFRTGSLKDLSGTGNDPSTLTGLIHSQGRHGRGVRFPASCTFSSADDTSLNLTSLSLIALTNQTSLGTDRRIACKRGVADYWDLYVTSGGVLTLKSGAASASIALSPTTQAASLGVTWATAGTPRAFRNGSLAGAMSGALTAAGSGAGVLNVGSYLAGSATNTWVDTIFSLVLINEALSDADMVRLMTELESGPSIVRRPSKHFSLPYPAKTPAEYAAEGIILDLAPQVVNGKIPDLSGNGYDATIVERGFGAERSGPFTGAIVMRKGAYAQLDAGASPFLFKRSYTVLAWAKPSSLDVVSSALLGGTPSNYVGRNGANLSMQYTTNTGASVPLNAPGNRLKVGQWVHCGSTLEVDGANITLRIFQDGVEVASRTDALILYSGLGTQFVNALTSVFPYGFYGSVAKFEYLDAVVLTPAEIRKSYLEGAVKCLLDARVHADGSCPVSLAAVGAGNEIANGWKVQSGTWQVVEDAPSGGRPGKRWLESQAAATVSIACDRQAYGSWWNEIRFNAAEHEWLFVATDPTSVSSASQNGYGVHVSAAGAVTIRERVAGVASTLVTPGISLVSGTSYQFWSTRRFDGLIEVWIKGGAFTSWTTLGTITDTTTTAGAFQVQYAGAANVESRGVFQLLGEMNVFEGIRAGILEGE